MKGPSPTEYIGGIVANQSSKMADTLIGSKSSCERDGIPFLVISCIRV